MTDPTIIGTPFTNHIAAYTGTPQTEAGYAPETGSNRKLYVFLGFETGVATVNFTVEWDSVALTEIISVREPPTGTQNSIRVFELDEADFPGSAADLVYDADQNLGNNLGIIAIQVKDAHQSTAVDEAEDGDVDSYDLAVTAAESLVLQAVCSGGTGTYAVASPATAVATAESAGDFRFGVGKINNQAAGTVTLNASGTDTTRRVHAAIAIPPASPSGGGGFFMPSLVWV